MRMRRFSLHWSGNWQLSPCSLAIAHRKLPHTHGIYQPELKYLYVLTTGFTTLELWTLKCNWTGWPVSRVSRVSACTPLPCPAASWLPSRRHPSLRYDNYSDTHYPAINNTNSYHSCRNEIYIKFCRYCQPYMLVCIYDIFQVKQKIWKISINHKCLAKKWKVGRFLRRIH